VPLLTPPESLPSLFGRSWGRDKGHRAAMLYDERRVMRSLKGERMKTYRAAALGTSGILF
jgi:hypothetical protein